MAKVDSKGRILYYINGKPVYANDDTYGFYNPSSEKKPTDWQDRGFNDHDPKTDDDHPGKKDDDRVGHRKNPDSPKDRDRHHDDNKGNGSKKYATYKLVRGSDGRLNVQYVDAKTGKVLTNKELGNYHIVSSASSIPGVYSQKPAGPGKDKGDKGDTGDEGKGDKGKKGNTEDSSWSQYRGDFNDHAANGTAGGRNNSKSPSSSSPGKSSTAPGPAEQGDTNGFYDPDNNRISFSPSLAAEKNANNKALGLPEVNYDTTSPSGFTPDQSVHPAIDTSLDDWNGPVVSGNLTSPFEGQNLSKATVVGSDVPSYSDQEKQDMAKTLAGEIDSRYTDPTSPEGVDEANHIMSTMVNRDEVFDGGLSDALHAPNAYSTWNNDKVAKNANANYNKNPALWDGLVDRFLADPSLRTPVTNYYNPGLVDPSWSKNLLDKTQIGPHMFGVDPNLSVPTRALTDDEISAVENNNINTSFMNSPAYAQGPELASTPPDVTGGIGTQLGNFPDAYSAQKDYNTPSSSPNPADIGGFISGYQAQKDYDPNNFDNMGVSVSHETFDNPSATNTSNFGTGVTAQRDYDPNSTDNMGVSVSHENFDQSNAANTSNLGTGITAQRDYDPNSPNNIGVSVSSMDSGFAQNNNLDKSGRFSTPSNFDSSRFGDNVTTDPNAVSNSSQISADNEAKVTNSVAGPTGFVSGYQAQQDYSTPSISSTPANTVSDAASVSNQPSIGFDNTEGIAGAPSTTDSSATSAGEGMDTTDSTSGVAPSGTAPGTTGGGLFGGLFGGDTTSPDTSAPDTGSVGDTGTDASSSDTDPDTGGFSDGYL